tara:strand:- start:695 stop:868 length:174 start_codon:yes stop_codon:yes gene_type:complete
MKHGPSTVSDIRDFDFEYDLSSASQAEKKKALDEFRAESCMARADHLSLLSFVMLSA